MPRTPLRYKAKRPYAKVVGVILILMALLLMLPLPLPFSQTLVTTGQGSTRGQITTLDCVWLSGTWSTAGPGTTTLVILSADGAVAYNDSLGFGTFSFYAPDAPYTAIVYSVDPVTVQISGSAWGPLIPVGLP
ncbi:MAG: hypothetical protein L3K02_05155 [Thermoplasmata archaeon]|nr:hypothetical protein [Thermoplasmata archaeon]